MSLGIVAECSSRRRSSPGVVEVVRPPRHGGGAGHRVKWPGMPAARPGHGGYGGGVAGAATVWLMAGRRHGDWGGMEGGSGGLALQGRRQWWTGKAVPTTAVSRRGCNGVRVSLDVGAIGTGPACMDNIPRYLPWPQMGHHR
jgi:hypothetical protein